MTGPADVHPDASSVVAAEPVLQELADGLRDLFSITWASVDSKARSRYIAAFLGPNKRAKATLMTQLEIACIVAPYSDVQVRSVDALVGLMRRHSRRVDPRIAFLVHFDPTGNDRLRAWGDQRELAIIPLYRSPRDGLPDAETLIRSLADHIYQRDPFALNEPVASDRDFFGRRRDAEDLFRSLCAGQVRSLFAMRRAGKTSIINRMRTMGGDTAIAMVDASDEEVHSLDAKGTEALVAATVADARSCGYAVAGSVARGSHRGETSLLAELTRETSNPLIIVFDEVDFIGPTSPANPRWQAEFVPFWRALRVAYQEARRQDRPVGILVCGVSSQAFREHHIAGHENPVFGFVPDQYLEPFGERESARMIKDLGLRCGLRFDAAAARRLYEACNGFPYWIRLGGSMIHHQLDIEGRPRDLALADVEPLIGPFIDGEGADHVESTLDNLEERDGTVMTAARRIVAHQETDGRMGRLAVRYGLAIQDSSGLSVPDGLVRAALVRPRRAIATQQSPEPDAALDSGSELVVHEIAVLHDRLERDLRTVVRGSLQASADGSEWVDRVLDALPKPRRDALKGSKGDVLMRGLYFLELKQIIVKHWSVFERRFGDKRRFASAMEVANDRPFAHAGDYDLADLALFRREYRWLQDRADA
jgi:hypothetical protein